MIPKVKALIDDSNKITILSGAGMSTESGISDFRSPGGVWTRYKMVTIQEFESDDEKRKYYWQYKKETIPTMLKAEPNAAHEAIGRLDKRGKLFWLLTQNIDGLHELGGVSKERIVRLHGNNREAVCLKCNDIIPIEVVLERLSEGDEVPLCDKCGGFLKPNTVSFGQNLDPRHLAIAEEASQDCDLFMALGSSLQVQPAASFVYVAFQNKRDVIIINREPTPYDDLAICRVGGSLAEVLPKIM